MNLLPLFYLIILPNKTSGAKVKVPLWKIYNYIAKVLPTGMQWSDLQGFISKNADGKAEITSATEDHYHGLQNLCKPYNFAPLPTPNRHYTSIKQAPDELNMPLHKMDKW